MTVQPLKKLLLDIAEVTFCNQEDNAEELIPYMLKSLDVISSSNVTLRNPLNTTVHPFPFYQREIALTGDEQIEGSYLLFDYSHSTGAMNLWGFETLQDLETMILGEGGYTNPNTTFMVPILYGDIVPFSIYYEVTVEGVGTSHSFNKETPDYLPGTIVEKWMDWERESHPIFDYEKKDSKRALLPKFDW